jgi:hypothetical protein
MQGFLMSNPVVFAFETIAAKGAAKYTSLIGSFG